MIRTLVVDDDRDKTASICTVLKDIAHFESSWIQTATTVAEAKRRLAAQHFELLVVDIALPYTAGGEVSAEAGIELIEEVHERPDKYRLPGHIIGLTAFGEIYRKVINRFASRDTTVVLFDPAAHTWSGVLTLRVKYLMNLEDQAEEEYLVDCLFVCALHLPELSALRANGWTWKEALAERDHTLYLSAQPVIGGKKRRMVAVAAPRMGLTATAGVTGKAIELYRPKMVFMLGIMAGVPSRVNLGDPVVADPCWDWGSGKWVEEDGVRAFRPSPHQAHADPWMRERFRQLTADASLLDEVWAAWPNQRPATKPTLRLGPVASGAAVLADGATLEDIKAHHRAILGVDMEAYAVYAVVEECRRPRPRAIVVKAVVDFADGEKGDEFQEYSAYMSAQVCRIFVERYLDTA